MSSQPNSAISESILLIQTALRSSIYRNFTAAFRDDAASSKYTYAIRENEIVRLSSLPVYPDGQHLMKVLDDAEATASPALRDQLHRQRKINLIRIFADHMGEAAEGKYKFITDKINDTKINDTTAQTIFNTICICRNNMIIQKNYEPEFKPRDSIAVLRNILENQLTDEEKEHHKDELALTYRNIKNIGDVRNQDDLLTFIHNVYNRVAQAFRNNVSLFDNDGYPSTKDRESKLSACYEIIDKTIGISLNIVSNVTILLGIPYRKIPVPVQSISIKRDTTDDENNNINISNKFMTREDWIKSEETRDANFASVILEFRKSNEISRSSFAEMIKMFSSIHTSMIQHEQKRIELLKDINDKIKKTNENIECLDERLDCQTTRSDNLHDALESKVTESLALYNKSTKELPLQLESQMAHIPHLLQNHITGLKEQIETSHSIVMEEVQAKLDVYKKDISKYQNDAFEMYQKFRADDEKRRNANLVSSLVIGSVKTQNAKSLMLDDVDDHHHTNDDFGPVGNDIETFHTSSSLSNQKFERIEVPITKNEIVSLNGNSPSHTNTNTIPTATNTVITNLPTPPSLLEHRAHTHITNQHNLKESHVITKNDNSDQKNNSESSHNISISQKRDDSMFDKPSNKNESDKNNKFIDSKNNDEDDEDDRDDRDNDDYNNSSDYEAINTKFRAITMTDNENNDNDEAEAEVEVEDDEEEEEDGDDDDDDVNSSSITSKDKSADNDTADWDNLQKMIN